MSDALNFGNALAEFALSAAPNVNDHFSKLAFLNWFGCTMPGAHEPSIEIFSSYYEEESPANIIPPIAREKGVNAAACAAIDCMSSAILAYDDIHFPTSLHPCGPIAAAIFALARIKKISGRDAVAALKIGMEIEIRVAETIFSPGTGADKGWYTTGIAGGIGAAAAVGRLLGLNIDEMKAALGLAAARASGTRGMHTAMSFCYAPAIAAESGYTAARLAQRGFTCQIKSLSGPNSLITLLAPNANFELGMDGLGEKWHCEDTACKMYPFGFVAYAAIKCGMELCEHIKKTGVTPEKVVLSVSPVSKRLGGSLWPENIYDSVVCLRYIIAGMLVKPNFAFTPVSGEFSVPTDIAEIMEHVSIEADDTLNDKQAAIGASFVDGTDFAYRCDVAPGSEKLPPSEEQTLEKFMAQAGAVVSSDKARELMDGFMNMEKLDDIASLLSLI